MKPPFEAPFSRRGTLKIAAAPTGGAAAAQGAGADVALLALCAEWRRAMDRNAAVVDRLACRLERDWSDEDHAQWDETGEAVSDLQDRVFAAKATTLAGIKAKAGVLDRMAGAYGIPAPEEAAASLVADVLALGGAA